MAISQSDGWGIEPMWVSSQHPTISRPESPNLNPNDSSDQSILNEIIEVAIHEGEDWLPEVSETASPSYKNGLCATYPSILPNFGMKISQSNRSNRNTLPTWPDWVDWVDPWEPPSLSDDTRPPSKIGGSRVLHRDCKVLPPSSKVEPTPLTCLNNLDLLYIVGSFLLSDHFIDPLLDHSIQAPNQPVAAEEKAALASLRSFWELR